MTYRERLNTLMLECWMDACDIQAPDWPVSSTRATLAAALFRERCLLEFGPERLADAPAGYSSLLADARGGDMSIDIEAAKLREWEAYEAAERRAFEAYEEAIRPAREAYWAVKREEKT